MHMKLKHTQNFVRHGVPRPKSTPNPTPTSHSLILFAHEPSTGPNKLLSLYEPQRCHVVTSTLTEVAVGFAPGGLGMLPDSRVGPGSAIRLLSPL